MSANSPAIKPEQTPRKAVVFISYAREDRQFVERLKTLFHDRGVETKGDWQLEPGVRYADELRAAIMSADTFLFVISPSSVASEPCRLEVEFAARNNKRLAPVVHVDVPDAAVYRELREIQYTFLRDGDDFEKEFQQLERGVKTDLKWVKSHSYWLQRAAEWETKKRGRSSLLRGADLQEAERWLAEAGEDATKDPRPTPLQTEYVRAGRQDEKKRTRIVLGAVSAGLVVTLVLLFIAMAKTAEARREKVAALQNLARAYVEKADRAWQEKDVSGVEILLANALALDDQRETREKLWEIRAKGTQLLWASSYRPGGSAVAFTRDGSRVILGCEDYTVRAWEVATGRVTHVLRGHKAHISAVALDSSERLLASGGGDYTIRLWDLTTGAEVRALDGHEEGIRNLAFDEDGSTLVSVGRDNTLRVWNVADGKQLFSARLKLSPVRQSALSQGARFLAYSGGDERNVLRLLDARTGAEIATLKKHTEDIVALAFSPDGSRLAAQYRDGNIHIFDTLNPSGPGISQRRRENARGLAFSHDGLRLATYSSFGSEDSVVVWDILTDAEVHKFPVESSLPSVGNFIFSADGRWLAAGGDTLRLWNLSSSSEVLPIAGHGTAIRSLAYSADGRFIASCGFDYTVRLWDARNGQEQRVFKVPDCRSVLFSPDATMLAANDTGGRVLIWDAESGASLYTFQDSTPRSTGDRDSLAFSPAGDAIYEAVDDDYLSWPVVPRKQPVINGGVPTSGRKSAFSPDGNMFAQARSKQLKLLNLVTRQEIIDKEMETNLEGLAFTADGTQLAVADKDGTIRIWSTEDGTELKVLRSTGIEFNRLAFSPDGQRLASAGYEAVKLWDVASGAEILRLKPQRNNMDWVGGLAFSPDGRFLAVGAQDSAVRLWSIENSDEVTTLRGHRNYIRDLTYDASGRLLLTAGLDETARLWDVSDARTPRLLATRGGVKAASLSPEGLMIAVSSGDETIQLSDAVTGNALFELREDRGKMVALAFSEDGLLASVAEVESDRAGVVRDYYVSVWDIAERRKVLNFREGEEFECIAFAPKGTNLLATGGLTALRLWNLRTGTEARALKGHWGTVTSLAFSRDGKRLASSSRDMTVRLWNVESGEEVFTFYGHSNWVEGVAFSPDEKLLASAGTDDTIRLWDTQSGREVFKLRVPVDSPRVSGAWFRRIAINPKTSVVAASTGDFSVRLWDLNSLTRFFSVAPAKLLEETENKTGLQISGLEYVQLK